jgi:hypothetical protein
MHFDDDIHDGEEYMYVLVTDSLYEMRTHKIFLSGIFSLLTIPLIYGITFSRGIKIVSHPHEIS